MTSNLCRLSLAATRYSHRTCIRRKVTALHCTKRPFQSTSIIRAPRKDEDDDDDESDDRLQPSKDVEKAPFRFRRSDLSHEERREFDSLSHEEQKEWIEEAPLVHDTLSEGMDDPEFDSEMNTEISLATNEVSASYEDVPPETYERIDGFMASGEEEPEDIGNDPEFEGDDITSLAHGELEQHREMREYARIAVWEMPLLYSMLWLLSLSLTPHLSTA